MWQPKNLFRVAQYTQLVRSPGIISWLIITRYRVNNRSAYISNILFSSEARCICENVQAHVEMSERILRTAEIGATCALCSYCYMQS